MVEDVHLNDTDDNEQEESLIEEEDEEKEEEAAEGEEADELLDEEAALRQQLEEEQAKAAEYLDGWQRARAELVNARKRWERESVHTYKNAVASVISKLLPVVDDFERAVEIIPEDLNDESWVDGALLIYRKLKTFLEQQGVKPIEVEPGMPFDPTRHQAVTHETHETFEADTIIAELQKGYKLNDRIVRPTLVRVSSGPPPSEAKDSETPKGNDTSNEA